MSPSHKGRTAALLAALLLFLSGCTPGAGEAGSRAAGSDPLPSRNVFEEADNAAFTKVYCAMDGGGFVSEDTVFITRVWDALNAQIWQETDRAGTGEPLTLQFYRENDSRNFLLTADGGMLYTDETGKERYFAGSSLVYQSLATLLSEHCKENILTLNEVWGRALECPALTVRILPEETVRPMTETERAAVRRAVQDFTGWTGIKREEARPRYGVAFEASEEGLNVQLCVFAEGNIIGVDCDAAQGSLHADYEVGIRVIERLNEALQG